jgi:hypothetical protein
LTVPTFRSELLSYENSYVQVPLDLVQVAEGWLGAVILQEVHRWCRLNASSKDKRRTHYHHGRWWMYRTQDEWATILAVSPSTAVRTLTQLRNAQMLLVDTFNQKKYDRTRWYAVDYAVVVERLIASRYERPARKEPVPRDSLDFGAFKVKLPGTTRPSED